MKKSHVAILLCLCLAACDGIPGTGASRKATPSPAATPSPTATQEATDPPSSTTPPPGSYSLTFSFTGPDVNPETVYCVWLEDESGNDIQNLYVCNTVLGIEVNGVKRTLTGNAIPNWLTKKYPNNATIDGVTGASTQQSFTVTRSLSLGSTKRFKVLFEIDRSRNGNEYFYDRPSFTYSTGLINLDDLLATYPLSLIGWMSNNTTGTDYGQQPKVINSIPDFEQYLLMTDLPYVSDPSGSTADMVDSASVTVSKN